MTSARPSAPDADASVTLRRVSPSAIGKHDLRHVARATIARHRLDLLIAPSVDAADEAFLWLADEWPWTPATDAAIDTRRPRWAAAMIPIDRVRPLSALDPELAVRELNRAFDPWPPESRNER